MTETEDPVTQVARWRPRPESIECRRLDGAVETYPVTAGRRAWQRLRSLLPADAVELVGRCKGAIVGRWQAPTAAPDAPDAPDAPEHDAPDEYDDTPSPDAALLRWLIREMRGIYSDQLRASREALAVMADAMRFQRDAMQLQRVPRDRDDDDDEPGFSKITDLLRQAGGLMAMQQQASAAAQRSSATTPPPRPPRDSTTAP